MDTVDYGTAATKPKVPVVNGSQRVEMVQTLTFGIVITLLVAIVAFPFVYYVATVVPEQQQRMHDLRIECLAHHTVKACMDLTDGRVPE